MGVTIADDWVWARFADDLSWIPINAKDVVSTVRMRSKENESLLFMEEMLADIIKELK